ncbi:MAG TPA: protein kinase [Myxococcota bacterium]|nr:protein kinase [Myxococcota bacterium]HRY92290.1 protein kinase [Myxococcota bacterium]HSA22568.1 protein kinase [Myxococcota bacterium]
MSTEHDILVPFLGVQLGLLTSRQVSAAARDGSEGLAARLVAQGALSAERLQLLEQLAGEAVRSHGGDLGATLDTFGGQASVVLSMGPRAAGEEEAAPLAGENPLAVTQEQPGRYTFMTSPGSSAGGDAVELGHGGLGRVLIAIDEHLEREVAFKELLRPELAAPSGTALDRTLPVTLARFLREARLTGRLEHPNIIPVYELGRRRDGSLYYTMKVVRGRTLARALEECRTLAERLRLLRHFADVCHAVAYAHSRGVVHRDLKPENVMLGEFGETVVLDWGLAKARGREDLQHGELRRGVEQLQGATSSGTQAGDVLGSPLYMSPEQAEGNIESVDERSDVWGLGVVLYQILTGQTPFTGVNAFEVLGRLMKEDVPPVRARCPGAPPELAAVAEKALARDQARRYPSARELAAEVEAYLTGGRVRTYAYSPWELVKRLVGQNKLAFAVGAIGVALLAVVLGLSMARISAERDLAQSQRKAALRFANFLVNDLLGELADLPEAAEASKAVLARSLEYYQAEVDPDSGDAAERLDLARAYHKVAHLSLQVGNVEGGLQAGRTALRILEDLRSHAPDDGEIVYQAVLTRWVIGNCLVRLTRNQEAIEVLEQSRTQAEAEAAEQPGSYELQDALWRIHYLLGDVRFDRAAMPEAQASYLLALAAARRMEAMAPNRPEVLQRLAACYDGLAKLARRQGQLQAALDWRRQDLSLADQQVHLQPANPRWKISRAFSLDELGMLELSMGDSQAALEHLRQASSLASLVADADPANKYWQQGAARIEMHLGQVLALTGQSAEARRTLRSALDRFDRLIALEPDDRVLTPHASQALDLLAGLELANGSLTEARTLFERALALDRQVSDSRPDYDVLKVNLALSHARLSALAAALGDLPAARQHRDTQLQMAERLVEKSAADPLNVELLADALGGAVRVALSQRKQPEARALVARYQATALRLLELAPDSQDLKLVAIDSGLARGDLETLDGHTGPARDAYRDALRRAQELVALDPGRSDTQLALARVRWRLGETARAGEGLRELRQREPDDLRVATELLQVALLTGRFQEVITLGGEALKRNPDSRNNQLVILGLIATAQALAGELPRARRTAREAGEVAPPGPLYFGDWQLAVLRIRLEGRLPRDLRPLWQALGDWNLGGSGSAVANAFRELAR